MKIGSEEKISTNKTNLNAMGDRVYPFQGYLQLVSSVKTVKQHIGMRYIKTEVLLSPPTPYWLPKSFSAQECRQNQHVINAKEEKLSRDQTHHSMMLWMALQYFDLTYLRIS